MALTWHAFWVILERTSWPFFFSVRPLFSFDFCHGLKRKIFLGPEVLVGRLLLGSQLPDVSECCTVVTCFISSCFRVFEGKHIAQLPNFFRARYCSELPCGGCFWEIFHVES